MEEAWAIRDYLPCSFKSEHEQNYIAFLWDAFQSNYENGKYQFAFLAFHMLTMSFVYCNIWQIKNNLPEDFNKALVGFSKDVEEELLNATSPFIFSRVNESAVFRFLKLIGCDNAKIGQYTKLVKDRNDAAHSNGNIFCNAQITLDQKIRDTLRLVNEIEQHSTPLILNCYKTFLKGSHDPDEREFVDERDQIREVLIHQNYLSRQDINICLGFEIGCLCTESNFEPIKAFHNIFIETYKEDD